MASSHQSSFELRTALHGYWSHPHAVCEGWRWPSNSSWEHQRTFHGRWQKGRVTHVLFIDLFYSLFFLFFFFSSFSHTYFVFQVRLDFRNMLSCLFSILLSSLLSFCLSSCPLFCSFVLSFDCPTYALLCCLFFDPSSSSCGLTSSLLRPVLYPSLARSLTDRLPFIVSLQSFLIQSTTATSSDSYDCIITLFSCLIMSYHFLLCLAVCLNVMLSYAMLGKRRRCWQWFTLKNCIRQSVLCCAQHPRHPPGPLSVRRESSSTSEGIHRRLHRSNTRNTCCRAVQMWCRCC